METQIRHDMRGATLLRGRLKMASQHEWVTRLYTTVNTTANALMFDGYLRKYAGVAGHKQGFEDNRVRLGAGLRFRGGTGQAEKLYVGPLIKKEAHFHEVGSELGSVCAKGAARLEWDTTNMKLQKPAATGNALLSYKLMRLTERMDVKATGGVVWTWNPRSSKALHVMPMLQLRENNWGITVSLPSTRAKGGKANIVFHYDL